MAIVYRHRKLGTNEVFYIGIGKEEKRAYNKRSRSQYWKNIVKKYGYEVDIIFDDISYNEAKEGEILLIKLYGRKDLGLGNLVNMTDGGEGMIGYKHNLKSLKKISDSSKNRIPTEETKIKMSNTRKGKAVKGHNHSEETKSKFRKIWETRIISEETRIKMNNNRYKDGRMVLNTDTGIFYISITEAAKTVNMSRVKLSRKIEKNIINFIYV